MSSRVRVPFAVLPSIRIVMMGTGDFAVPSFEHLVEAGWRIVTLVTQPDRPQGRKQELLPSVIKQTAQRAGFRSDSPRT